MPYRVWTQVVLLSPRLLVHVLDFIILCIFGDEILERLGHLVFQSIRLVFSDLQRRRKNKTDNNSKFVMIESKLLIGDLISTERAKTSCPSSDKTLIYS